MIYNSVELKQDITVNIQQTDNYVSVYLSVTNYLQLPFCYQALFGYNLYMFVLRTSMHLVYNKEMNLVHIFRYIHSTI